MQKYNIFIKYEYRVMGIRIRDWAGEGLGRGDTNNRRPHPGPRNIYEISLVPHPVSDWARGSDRSRVWRMPILVVSYR